ncbi:hypothetical protein K788_0000672 [Paraburkholderia caribensis MBA4]|uniref:Uncharacterized protein n=1 Tax=Paraburkholderia caribensis MBA4 TaxID=1323664 RepID=A0A0N7JV49_9BURK|nr:hypothetical protein [Paraburkholderia caribensis]ALL68221.1 hypothetical protein K788_0000672 [Paraburkholderia caribensis MBA4]
MLRKTRTASQLQDEVRRRIERAPEVIEDGVKIRVPRPQLQEPDASGCNWTMKNFGNAIGFDRTVDEALKAVQKEYNLSEDTKDLNSLFGDPKG